MQTQEIPREQWPSFFDSFSRQHEGWLATLEVFAETVGAQPEAEELPFEGISLDAEDGELDSVIISFGKSPSQHITHTIHQPKHLWLQQTPEGADAALEIKAGDNSNTLLRFRSPMLPEFVDGIV
ncbi:MAG TPA: DUF5335 family protein [Pyrinomonadaceae bacterium]|nr:DUF5335 family protein [Pyrinomonadaceae bacterium]